MSACTLYAIFADTAEAERIGRMVVEERLAACVNILGACHSIYRWQDEIETATEVPAILKSTLAHADALIARIAELHSYEVPAIVVWPVERLPESFAKWIDSEVR